MGRKLTGGEIHILELIQQEYGSQNTEEGVFFTDKDEAVIFIKALDGTSPMLTVLTNLAKWYEDGTIANDDELINEWLRIPNRKS
jgi:hypothetical protein